MSDSSRTAADVATDEQITEALADFASWPTKPQEVALAALVAAHGSVRTVRVRRNDEIDWLRVQWGETFAPQGALLAATGDLVEPSDPRQLTLGIGIEGLQALLGAEILRGHLDALRAKAQARGDAEPSMYVVDSELQQDVTTALTALTQWRADVVEVLARVEAEYTQAIDAANSAASADVIKTAEDLRHLIAQAPTL